MMLRAVCTILELKFFYEMCVVPKNDDFEFRRGRLFYKKMFWPIFSYDIELHFLLCRGCRGRVQSNLTVLFNKSANFVKYHSGISSSILFIDFIVGYLVMDPSPLR